MTRVPTGFGPHLMIDAYGCPAELLASVSHVRQFLQDMPDLIGMTPISQPLVLKFDVLPDFDESGVTGIIVIAQSHISIHTYPEKGFFTTDIYSCAPFDLEGATIYTKNHFQAPTYDAQIVWRGQRLK